MKARAAFVSSMALVVAISVAPAPPALADKPAGSGAGLIVFAGETADGSQLWTVWPNGTHLRQITHVPGSASQPDWSPDGSTITFELGLPNDAGAQIAFVDADGSNLRVLPVTDGACVDGQPSFTPDGRRVVYAAYDCGVDEAIFSRAIDGSDGKHLSFVRYDQGVEFQQALTTSNLSGGDQLDLVPPSFDVGIKTAWSPDGRDIVFTRDANNYPDPDVLQANVATIAADGTGLRNLTDYRGGRLSAFAGSYSPDGRWIVFRLQDNETGTSGLWKMWTDGTHRSLIFSQDGLRARGSDWGGRP